MRAKRWLAVAITTGAILTASGATAQYRPVPPPRPPAPFRADVVVYGAPLPVYHLGADRYVEGQLGQRYVVRVFNPTDRRAEVVVAVDGLDAIDGTPASIAKRGYVVGPRSSIDVEGFRTSMHDVAAFRFTTVPDSYASRTGHPSRVGRIEVWVFPEKASAQPPLMPRPRPRASRPEEAPGAAAPRDQESQGLGTQFGEQRQSWVRETTFERAQFWSPETKITLRYDDRQGLCAKGLRQLCDEPLVRPQPIEPFGPAPEAEPRRFAQPPPGY